MPKICDGPRGTGLDERERHGLALHYVPLKIDHVGDAAAQAECEANLRAKYPNCVVMSARRADDIAHLREMIIAFFQQDMVEAELFLPWSAQQMRGEIFARCEVLEERANDEGATLRVRGEGAVVERLIAQFANSPVSEVR